MSVMIRRVTVMRLLLLLLLMLCPVTSAVHLGRYTSHPSLSLSLSLSLSVLLVQGLLVCLSVCLFVCTEFFSAVFDPILIELGHMLYVWV